MKRIHYVAPILLQALIYCITYPLFKIFCRIKYVGLHNIANLPKGVIFAANHGSEWDGPLVRTALRFLSIRWSPMYYVSRTSEFYQDSGWRQYIYGGTLFKLVGAYPVYSGKKDYAYSLQNFINIIKLDRNVTIFPEGRRTKDGSFGDAHGGVAYLAHATGASVVPVGMTGLVNLTFTDFIFFRRRIVLNFGTPIRFEKMDTSRVADPAFYKSEAQKIMNRIIELTR